MLDSTEAQCWQFRIISPQGSVFGERKTFYSPAAAEHAARNWLSPPW
ncbi:MAG: hypothetical protein JOZ78_04720 [Chroococcidiopsidaceae cyanobacterium CP_BM_ER_R8_30]|nr:hypothetical protein [Chroococcidiopsidaceae cyanobacterium CP_BM_ER_R8_30]